MEVAAPQGPRRPASVPSAAALHRPNLDLLRSIAVLFVVTDHTLLAFHRNQIGECDLAWLGTLGVFFFFVHTALVLMWSLERKPHTLDFYIRRVFRIYPLAAVAITAALLTHAPLQGTNQDFFQYRSLAPGAILQDFFLVQNFGHSLFSAVNVLWSLPLEVQMYVALPFLFFFAAKERLIWPLVLLWTLVVAFAMLKFVDPNDINLLTVIPMFLPGVMAYIGFSRWRPLFPAWTLTLLLAALVSYSLYEPTNRKGWYVNLVLGLTLPRFRQIRSAWLIRVSGQVARYSYGIYLFHPFALVLGPFLLRRHPVPLQLAAEFLAIAVLSVTAYHLVEAPCIRLGSRLARFTERWAKQRLANPHP